MTAFSVCCLTSDRPAMVAAMLGRPARVADDIVVAVDSRVDPRQLAPARSTSPTPCSGSSTPTRPSGRGRGCCRSAATTRCSSSTVTRSRAPRSSPRSRPRRRRRRSCSSASPAAGASPTSGHWLAERPWWPDFQRRLVRRGPTARLPHRLARRRPRGDPVPERDRAAVPPGVRASAASPIAGSERARYEAERPGMIAVGGGPMNAILYGPEHFATLRPEPTPRRGSRGAPCRARCRRRRRRGARPDLPIVTARRDRRAPPGRSARGAGLPRAAARSPSPICAPIPATTHCSWSTSPTSARRRSRTRDVAGAQLRLAAAIARPAPGRSPTSGCCTPLPCDVPAGASRLAEAVVDPATPGRYMVEIDLLNERAGGSGAPSRVRAGGDDALGPVLPREPADTRRSA